MSSRFLASTFVMSLAGALAAPMPAAAQVLTFCGEIVTKKPVIEPVIYPNLVFGQADTGFDCQMWQAFIYLNWPAAQGQRGAPDASKKFGAAGPTVWETYKTVDQLFLPYGRDPGPWNLLHLKEVLPPALAAQVARGEVRHLTMESKVSRQVLGVIAQQWGDKPVLREITQVGGGILYDQNGNPVYYEILVNEDTYNYVWRNGLYNAKIQLAFTQNNTILLPPGPSEYGQNGPIEMKVAWKILSPAEVASGRFHMSLALIPGSLQPVQVGLVGMHVFQVIKGFDQGAWATFLQVDSAPMLPFSFSNPACPSCSANNKATNPTQVVQIFPDDSQAVSVNDYVTNLIQQYNQQNGVRSPWQYYKLVNVQWPVAAVDVMRLPKPVLAPLPDGKPNTQTLMNPVIETFLQQQGTNCLGCHVYGTIAAGKNASSYSFLFGHAQGPP
jgi:hypothetical protein